MIDITEEKMQQANEDIDLLLIYKPRADRIKQEIAEMLENK